MSAPRRNFKNGGRRRKVCNFCQLQKNSDTKVTVDYKNYDLLKKYVSDRGKILPRRVTGTCAKHQRLVTVAIKRARHMAILPFTKD